MLELDHRLPDNLRAELEELLKSFSQIPKDKFEAPCDNRFPLTEKDKVAENGVEIRRNSSIHRYRKLHSKTTDFQLAGRQHSSSTSEKDFDIRGIIKFQMGGDRIPLKLENSEYLRFENGDFCRIDEKTNRKAIVQKNVLLKSARLTSKKDVVEFRDCVNLSYILYFESSKAARNFIENDKIQCYVNGDKTTITKTLLRLLGKRSSRELLERKGIYRNEPIFGNTLSDIYKKCGNEVPKFIYRTIELIERPENITSLGLYRTSGNLSTIQKIRFAVDNGNLNVLDEYCKDVDVLTGSLKMFFRELREPLINCEVCDTLLEIIRQDQKSFSKRDRDKIRTTLADNLPEGNLATLFVLIRHLLTVVRYKEENKMDSYNLAVCWGPTAIFSVIPDFSKDVLTQSQNATRLMEFMLNFYGHYPEELEFKRKASTSEYSAVLQRQESKDSIQSYDSSGRLQKKNSSTLNLAVDEVIRRTVETIEFHLDSEGLYKKSGSSEKTSKILKKMSKRRAHELDKYKADVHDFTDALKKYLRESNEVLVTSECVREVLSCCDETRNCLEHSTRLKIIKTVEDLPKKDTFIFLIKHLIKVIEHEYYHKVSRRDLVGIWTNVLNYQERLSRNDQFFRFLSILLDVFDDNKPDVVKHLVPSPQFYMSNVIKDFERSQQERDRYSKYDNVPEISERGEASLLDDDNNNFKTEQTKL